MKTVTNRTNGVAVKQQDKLTLDIEMPEADIRAITKKAKERGLSVPEYVAMISACEIRGDEFHAKLEKDTERFGQWLKGVPPVGDREPEADVRLKLDLQHWSYLTQAAAAHKTSIGNVIAYFLTCHADGLSDWGNDNWELAEPWNGMDSNLKCRPLKHGT